MTETTPFLPGLSPLRRKPLTAEQDAGNLTSNGGLILLRESALRSEVATVVADAVPDTRNQLLVTHSYRAMVTARMMAIAAGHEAALPSFLILVAISLASVVLAPLAAALALRFQLQ